jgi:hypothetical protein
MKASYDRDSDALVLFKPKLSSFDLGGSGSRGATVKQMKDLLDRMRKEDA